MGRTTHNTSENDGNQIPDYRGGLREAFLGQSIAAYGFLQVIGVLLVLAGIYSLATRPKDIIPRLATVVIGILLAVGPPLFLKHAYRSNRLLQQEFSANISEQGIEFASDASRTQNEWRAFCRLAETQNLFLLYQSEQCMNVLPKRAFLPGEDEAFRALVTQKLPPKAEPEPKPNLVKTIIFWLLIVIAALLLLQIVSRVR